MLARHREFGVGKPKAQCRKSRHHKSVMRDNPIVKATLSLSRELCRSVFKCREISSQDALFSAKDCRIWVVNGRDESRTEYLKLRTFSGMARVL